MFATKSYSYALFVVRSVVHDEGQTRLQQVKLFFCLCKIEFIYLHLFIKLETGVTSVSLEY